MRGLLFALGALLFAAPLDAQDRWLRIDEGAPAQYVDTSSVRRLPDVVAWTKTSYARDQIAADGKLRYRWVVQRLEVECKYGRLRTLSSVLYRADGSVAEQTESETYAPWVASVPDSVGEVFVRWVCAHS